MKTGKYIRTEEHRKITSDALKGHIAWNKGKKCPQIAKAMIGNKNGKFNKGYKMSETTKQKLREKTLFRFRNGMPEETKIKLVRKGVFNHFFGKKHSMETKQKISMSKRNIDCFDKFINSDNVRERHSIEYKNWRNAVFERDNFTCQISGKVSSGDIIVHHLENFSNNPELRYDINNGITLNIDIHKLFHDIYGYTNNTREQFIRFFYDYIFKGEGLPNIK